MPRFVRTFVWITVIAGFFLTSSACVYTYRPDRVQTRAWYRPDGCFVKRVIYPCYSAEGNLKIQTTRCPDGRADRRRWLHPDARCGGGGSGVVP